jgi:hypothetical protein
MKWQLSRVVREGVGNVEGDGERNLNERNEGQKAENNHDCRDNKDSRTAKGDSRRICSWGPAGLSLTTGSGS